METAKAAIWKRDLTLEQINESGVDTLIEHMGIVFTAQGADSLEATMPVAQHNKQIAGLLHGGASAVLAETLGSYMGYLLTEGDSHVVGLELNLSHLRAVRRGIVRGVCTPLHLGRRHFFFEIKLYDDLNQLTCTARHTVLRVDPTQCKNK